MRRLRVMRGADDVAVQLFSQDPRIAFLHSCRHRLANERKSLVAVEADQLEVLTVKIKALGREFGFAETDVGFVVVECLCGINSRSNNSKPNRIKFRTINIP